MSAVGLCLAAAGCGEDGPTRYEVSGTVQYQGKPVPAGRIIFTPDAAQGNQGPQGVAIIKDGRYSTAAGSRGTVGGPHQVRIAGYDGAPVQGEEFMMTDGTPLFPEYTTTADLPREAAEVDFDVPAQQ